MEYHPLDPDVIRDPYPTYARLRREAPLHRTALGFLVVSRYHDALEILRSPDRFSSVAMGNLIEGLKALSSDAGIRGGETLIGSDPPVHSRLRKIVNRAFTPKRVAALEPRIRAIAIACADRLVARGEGELMADLAIPLPIAVIAEILGIDPTRGDDFKRWSAELMAATTGVAGIGQRAALERSFAERAAYLEEVVAERRRHPQDDVISALVRAEQDEEGMSAQEVGNFVVLLLVAGNETTTNLIGNAVLTLLHHADLLRAMTSDLSRLPNLVEESLRHDSPVQLTLRQATSETHLPCGSIAAGEVVGLLLASANRDERVFADPDRFDPAREGPPHLAFGFGTHLCLGAVLARLEARVALEVLLSRVRDLELADPMIEHAASLLVRGPKRVPLRLAAR